jgi:hypothetical protein
MVQALLALNGSFPAVSFSNGHLCTLSIGNSVDSESDFDLLWMNVTLFPIWASHTIRTNDERLPTSAKYLMNAFFLDIHTKVGSLGHPK